RNELFSIKKAPRYFRIVLSKRVVGIHEEFEVLARTYIHGKDFKIEGIENFLVIEGPEYTRGKRNEKEKPLYQIRYVLKSVKSGYNAIGPASIRVDKTIFESELAYVKVNESGAIPRQRYGSKTERIIKASLAFMFGCILILAIYNIKERGLLPDDYFVDGKVMADHTKHAYIEAESVQLQTGINPYQDFSLENIEDDFSKNTLRIINGKYYDAVVMLVNYSNNKTERHHYIRAGDKYEISSIS